MKEFRVPLRSSGQRADVFIASKYRAFSRSSLGKLFDRDKVRSGKKILKAGQRLKPRQKVIVDDSMLLKKPPVIDMTVIYEDKDVVVINKPAGILTHSKGALNDEASVASFIKDKI